MDLDSFKYQFRNHFTDIPRICLLGIRGYLLPLKVQNEVVYDDAIVRYIDGDLKIFTASVDPGKYYIDHPINPHGCAKLKTGLWHYQLGEHHSKRALVQADEVTVYRLNRFGTITSEQTGWWGLNIHSGGPEYLVGRYSAGCQVIKSKEPWGPDWMDFFLPIKTGVDIFKQCRIPYLLVDKLEAIPLSDQSAPS